MTRHALLKPPSSDCSSCATRIPRNLEAGLEPPGLAPQRFGFGKGKGYFQLEGAFGVGPEGEVVVFRGIECRFVGVGVRITLEEVARKVQGNVDEVEIEFSTPARL